MILQQPNFLGAVEDMKALAPAAKATGALLVVSVDAPTLGVLAPPGEFGADIALGEGQPLGNRLDFGGPSFGFFAAQGGSTCARCRAGSRARRPTPTAAGDSC